MPSSLFSSSSSVSLSESTQRAPPRRPPRSPSASAKQGPRPQAREEPRERNRREPAVEGAGHASCCHGGEEGLEGVVCREERGGARRGSDLDGGTTTTHRALTPISFSLLQAPPLPRSSSDTRGGLAKIATLSPSCREMPGRDRSARASEETREATACLDRLRGPHTKKDSSEFPSISPPSNRGAAR